MQRTAIAPVASASVFVAAALAAWGTFGEDEDHWASYLIVLAIIAVGALAVFAVVVPRAERAGAVGLVLSALGVLSVAVFWSGLPVVFGAAACCSAGAARDQMPGRAAIALGALAIVADLVVYVAGHGLTPELTGGHAALRGVEQLDRVEGGQWAARPLERLRELHEAAGVRAREQLRARGEHVGGLAVAEVAGGLGLHDVVDAGAAAADVLLGGLDDLERGDPPQHRLPRGGQPLRVAQVARVLVGDHQRQRVERAARALVEELREVARVEAVVLQVRAAARGVDGDRQAGEVAAQALREALGLARAARVGGQRAAAALRRDDDLPALGGERAGRSGVDVAERDALDTAGEQRDPAAARACSGRQARRSLARAAPRREARHRPQAAGHRPSERGERERGPQPPRVGQHREEGRAEQPVAGAARCAPASTVPRVASISRS